MKYFGIKTPGDDSYVWWIANSEYNAWKSFFMFPNSSGEYNAHRMPIAEAIAAYKAIGYQCVELLVSIKNESTIAQG